MLPPPSRSDFTSVPVSAMPSSTRSTMWKSCRALRFSAIILRAGADIRWTLRGRRFRLGRLIEAGQSLRADEQARRQQRHHGADRVAGDVAVAGDQVADQRKQPQHLDRKKPSAIDI